MNIYVVYDSENRHTEVLAEAVAEGAGRVEGANVYLHHAPVSEAVTVPAVEVYPPKTRINAEIRLTSCSEGRRIFVDFI